MTVRITAAGPDGRRVLVEFFDALACERVAKNLDVHARREKLQAERRREKKQREHAEFSESAPLEPTADLTDEELAELTAATSHALLLCCPMADSPRDFKRDLRGNVVKRGTTDPDKDAKELARHIATTARAYEQNGWATDVRIEVWP